MPLAQHMIDERRRELRHVIPYAIQRFRFRQIIVDRFDPLLPFIPALLADVRIDQKLLVVSSLDARHAAETARILVLFINDETIFLADLIEVIHSLAVLLIIRRVHLDDGMDAFSTAVHQTGHGKLQFMDQRVLLRQIHVIALHQCVAIFHHVAVLAALAIQRVESDPRTDFRIIIAHHGSKISFAFSQLSDQLPGSLLV